MSFEEKLREGQDGEREVGEHLLSKGFRLVPLYQFTSHDAAPVLFAKEGRFVLPDLDVYTNEKSFFVEVKTKKRWVRFMPWSETGLNERLARQYLEVQRLTGKRVYLLFLHKFQEPTGLFWISLTKFVECARRWDGRNEKTGAYITTPELLCAFEHLVRVPGFAEAA